MDGALLQVRDMTRAAHKAALARDEAIRVAHRRGHSLRAIAATAGLSFQRVHQIVQAERDAIGAPTVS